MMITPNRFLLVLYTLSTSSMSFVSETSIQDHLKVSYKKIHELASFWEAKKCVKSMTQRGGITQYQITALGLLEIDEIQLRKKRFLGVGLLLIVGVISCLVIFTLL